MKKQKTTGFDGSLRAGRTGLLIPQRSRVPCREAVCYDDDTSSFLPASLSSPTKNATQRAHHNTALLFPRTQTPQSATLIVANEYLSAFAEGECPARRQYPASAAPPAPKPCPKLRSTCLSIAAIVPVHPLHAAPPVIQLNYWTSPLDRYIHVSAVMPSRASAMRGDSEQTPLLGNNSHGKNSALRAHFAADVSKNWADLVLLFCYIITGLLDSSAVFIWGSFVSMQTGKSRCSCLGV
jgi:hypothetical protein